MSKPAEHFDSRERQAHAARVGTWVFLGSESLLFAGLFAVYVASSSRYGQAFHDAAKHNTIVLGSVNTFVLLTSSLFVVLALAAIQRGMRRLCTAMILVTIMLGFTFLVIKGFEYAKHIDEGLLPGRWFHSQEVKGPAAIALYTLYWLATGLHALHVIAGIVVLGVMTVGVHRGLIDRDDHVPLELGGLYWHLVDIMWVFLWPLFYLLR